MYAIVRTGGKQYKVKAGNRIRVELLEKSPGDEFDMEEVLFVGGKKSYLGEPILSEAKVRVLVVKQEGKAKKILVFKKKRRQGYRKIRGHRQLFTELLVKSITTPDGESVFAQSDGKFDESVDYEPEKENFPVSENKPVESTGSPDEKNHKPPPQEQVEPIEGVDENSGENISN